MTRLVRGGIPRDAYEVASDLSGWANAWETRRQPFLRRSLRRASETLREVLAERDALKRLVAQLEGDLKALRRQHEEID